MEFDPSSPIWLQLVAEFTRRIVVGQWPQGQRIPGVRELALELRVNPNTVQRALAELDGNGLSRSERTSGRYVTSDATVIEAARAKLAETMAVQFARGAHGLCMSLDAAQRLIAEVWTTIHEGEQQ